MRKTVKYGNKGPSGGKKIKIEKCLMKGRKNDIGTGYTK